MTARGTAQVVQGNALALDLADSSVDLIVTSPPYFGLRSYTDGGQHLAQQVGAEASPTEFVDALIAATAEMMRVLKPTGSIWVNLGDKYAGGGGQWPGDTRPDPKRRRAVTGKVHTGGKSWGYPSKSLMGIPWRYAIRCTDELGLILRAEVVWSKPNGLPESVTDRVRRNHETWFHFTKSSRYFAGVDEIREPHVGGQTGAALTMGKRRGSMSAPIPHQGYTQHRDRPDDVTSPLGKLPGSVWSIPTQPLRLPPELGVEHFAAFPMEWPRRIIAGWSPTGVCTACGQGRRPVSSVVRDQVDYAQSAKRATERVGATGGTVSGGTAHSTLGHTLARSITGYACACTPFTDHPKDAVPGGAGWGSYDSDNARGPAANGKQHVSSNYKPRGAGREYHFDTWTPAPTEPAVVLDPFGGTGTTALMAMVMGRHGISVDLSSDYCRLAEWRLGDAKQLAKAEQKVTEAARGR